MSDDVQQGPEETTHDRLKRLPKVLNAYASDIEKYGKPLDSGLPGILRFCAGMLASGAAVPEPKPEWDIEPDKYVDAEGRPYLGLTCNGKRIACGPEVTIVTVMNAHNAVLAGERQKREEAERGDKFWHESRDRCEALLVAERAAAAKAVKVLKEALVPIAALKICDDHKPFTELSPDLLTAIRQAHDLILSALAFYEQGSKT